MSGAPTVGLVHALAALLALAMAALVWRAPGARWLAVFLASTAVWAGHLAWWLLDGASRSQVLWLPAVEAATGALLAWTLTALRPGRALTRFLVPLWLTGPGVLLAAELALAPDAVVVRTDSDITYGWFYGVHVLVVLAMMMATAALWAGVRSDPSRTLRLVAALVVTGLLGAGVAQTMQLMVLDLVLVVTGVLVVALVLRAEPGLPQPRGATHPALPVELGRGPDAGSDPAAQLADVFESHRSVVVVGARFLSHDDAERAALTLRVVVDPHAEVAIAFLDEEVFVAVVPEEAEVHLEDAASGWQRPHDLVPSDDSGPRSISLSPLLAGDLVVHRGTAGRMPALLGAVRRDLARL